MRIEFVEIINFRKLRSIRLDFDKSTTILVGANNSGKTSAMVALRYFLLHPDRLKLRDVTIAHWTKFDALGNDWESGAESSIKIEALLPVMDVWLDVPIQEIQHVVDILPTLDWSGGRLGVRLCYQVKDLEKLRADYLEQRRAVKDAKTKGSNGKDIPLNIWPRCLTDFLDRKLHVYIELGAFPLNPEALVEPDKTGQAQPQALSANLLPFEQPPFKRLIKIDEIAAQRDFTDAGTYESGDDKGTATSSRYKRRLSAQLRSYYDLHLDPAKSPSEHDYEALGAIQVAEHSFDKRLAEGFHDAFGELENLGYPGMSNPKLTISTLLAATDGLKHGSSVQYQVAEPSGDGVNDLRLPEDYSGLGFQNLIAMAFMLMRFRDAWMRVKKAGLVAGSDNPKEIQLMHLVLIEEPEAHLHAQVQQVFINNAYELLRKHPDLGDTSRFCTQMVVSTHSSHIAHESDFSNLRYFRRHPPATEGESPTTTIANLSSVFGQEDETMRFVNRYLQVTHCDLFFADGVIFVEGQAERILVPHFIKHHFTVLSRRYVTLLDLGGSHAHRFRNLIDILGIATLIIADLDATIETKSKDKNGKDVTKWKSVRPQIGIGQQTANPVLKTWHPAKESIDELVALSNEGHECRGNQGYKLYVAYQKPLEVDGSGKKEIIIPRTFEDALIFENYEANLPEEGSRTTKKIKLLCDGLLSPDELEDKLFKLLKDAEKAAFALDCLMMPDPKALKPPSYIRAGLEWFQRTVSENLDESQFRGTDKP